MKTSEFRQGNPVLRLALRHEVWRIHMHRIFGIFGSSISSATLLTWTFIAVFGMRSVLPTCIAYSVAFGLFIGFYLALVEHATKGRLGATLTLAVFAGVSTIVLILVGRSPYTSHDLPVLSMLLGFGAVLSVVSGFTYWLSAKAYVNLRLNRA